MAGVAQAKRPVKAFVPPAERKAGGKSDGAPMLDAASAPAIPGAPCVGIVYGSRD